MDYPTVALTIHWISSDAPSQEIVFDPRRGWYALKKILQNTVPHLPIPSPLRISLFQLDGNIFVECQSGPITEGEYYALVRDPILHERLDYIYPMGEADLWRWTYQPVDEGVAREQISFIFREGRFCGIQEYREARQAGGDVPWHTCVEDFLSSECQKRGEGRISETARWNLLDLWYRRH